MAATTGKQIIIIIYSIQKARFVLTDCYSVRMNMIISLALPIRPPPTILPNQFCVSSQLISANMATTPVKQPINSDRLKKRSIYTVF